MSELVKPLAGALYEASKPVDPIAHDGGGLMHRHAITLAEAALSHLGLDDDAGPWLVAVAAEIHRQDALHPAGYPVTRDGQRCGIAAAEDELAEVKEAWRMARCKCPTPNCGHHDWSAMHAEAVQAAAVIVRMIRDGAAPATPGAET